MLSTLLKKQLQQKKEMEGQEYLKKSKVIKIDSKKSWEHYISYATNQSYPVSLISLRKIIYLTTYLKLE